MRFTRMVGFFLGFGLAVVVCAQAHAQAAVLMENADGISRVFDPTGHEALYFARICAASPTRLRRCAPGEMGVVISRYDGVGGYDWLAVPLLPYLYAVESPQLVPERVDHETVQNLRLAYHAAQLGSLDKVPEGGRIRRGWNQLVGAAYERRIYAFRFDTSQDQDDALMAWMNAGANRSHFNIVFRNCADLSSRVLDFYFPGVFRRHLLPDGGMTTPRQVAYELARYAQKHPELRLTVLEIPQIPGYRRPSRKNRSVADSLLVSGYVVPVALLNPFVAAAVVADSLLWGRYPLPLAQAEVLAPARMEQLAATDAPAMTPRAEGRQSQVAYPFLAGRWYAGLLNQASTPVRCGVVGNVQ